VTPPVDEIARLRAWGEARDWAGYDPYDALNSPAAPVLTLGTRLGRRLLTQLVKHSPLNLRPALGIHREHNAMAIAAVANGYARLWSATGDESARLSAERWLDWLAEHHVESAGGIAWGYHFDVETRFFFYPRHSPNTIATSFVLQSLIEGSTTLGEPRWREPVARGCDFLRSAMLIDAPGRCFFRYVPASDELIHNANLLAIATLARAGELLDDESLLEPAARALPITLAAQEEAGSWPYAEHGGAWVDNFHTGYVLEALAACTRLDDEVRPRLERGVDFWARELFLADGTPKFLPERVYPLDSQCYAQAIETWLAMRSWRPDAVERARAVADRLVADMLAPSGAVTFQRRRRWSNRVAFTRWAAAPAFSALARLAQAEAAESNERETLCASGSI
jgi:hypothetical protein